EGRNFWTIYVGEVYGMGMEREKDSYVSYVLEAAGGRKKIQAPVFDRNLFPVPVKRAVEEILKGVFSYGFSSNPIVITGRTTAFAFLNEIKKIRPNTIFVSDSGIFNLFETFPITDFLEVENDWRELPLVIDGFEKPKRDVKPVPKLQP